jgi:hypothetical protein
MNMKLLDDATGLNLDEHFIKLIVGALGAVGDVLVSFGMPEGKAGPLMTAITAITVLVIAGISHVQSSKLKAQGAIGAASQTPTAPPTVQVNQDSTVSNQPKTTADAPAQPAPQPQPFTPAQMAALQQTFAAMLAPHLKPKPPLTHTPPPDLPPSHE